MTDIQAMDNADVVELYNDLDKACEKLEELEDSTLHPIILEIRKIQSNIGDQLEAVDICPLCGGEIVHNDRYYRDSGHESNWCCSECGAEYEY